MSIRGIILILLCLWYSIGSYTIQAQDFVDGEWIPLSLIFSDPKSNISQRKCGIAPRAPYGYEAIKFDYIFKNTSDNKHVDGVATKANTDQYGL